MKRAHVAQTRPASCVAACVCIVRCLRGETPTEAELDAEATGPAPTSLAPVLSLPGAYQLRGQTEEDDVRALQVALARGDAVVALVLAAPYAAWLLEHHPTVQSRHGPIAPPGPFGGSLHAVVVAARTSRKLALLDPYHDGDSQPFWVEEDELRLFLGVAGVAVPRP